MSETKRFSVPVLFWCFLFAGSTCVPRRDTAIASQGFSGIPPRVHFVDIAARAGLTAKTEDGGEKTKKYIIETTGSGAAFFDYDNDGWPDIFLVNGTTLEGFPKNQEPTSLATCITTIATGPSQTSPRKLGCGMMMCACRF